MRWLVLVVALAACAPDGKGRSIDIDRAMGHVHALAKIGPRPHGSEGSRAALAYIEGQLQQLGATPERLPVGSVQIPAIEVLGELRRQAKTVTTTDPNLIVRFGGSGKALLYMAHYDTVHGTPGAIDNAAAVAILIELARGYADEKPSQPVILAFTAAEEVGLAGAEALAAQRGSEVAFAFALDLIGGDGALTLNGAGELIGRAEMNWLGEAAERAGVVLSAPLAHRVISRWWPQAERADHGAFTRRGIRAVHFYNRGNDGEWIDVAYHTAFDVPSRINRRAIDETAKLLRALSSLPLPEHRGNAVWIPWTNSSMPTWILLALEGALVLTALAALHLARRRVQLRKDTDDASEGGAGLFAGIGCYVLAFGAAVLGEVAIRGAHPLPWIHQPLPALIASTLLVLGLFGVLALATGQLMPWTGAQRYRAIGAIVPLLAGVALLVFDAPELAWIFLVPAALIASAPAPIAIIAAALPGVVLLHPFLLREAYWNGFLPPNIPLAAWVGVLAIPLAATLGLAARSLPTRRSVTIGLAVLATLAVATSLALTFTSKPECKPDAFKARSLACEFQPRSP